MISVDEDRYSPRTNRCCLGCCDAQSTSATGHGRPCRAQRLHDRFTSKAAFRADVNTPSLARGGRAITHGRTAAVSAAPVAEHGHSQPASFSDIGGKRGGVLFFSPSWGGWAAKARRGGGGWAPPLVSSALCCSLWRAA